MGDPSVARIREELTQYTARLAELTNALRDDADMGAVAVALAESVVRAELWKRSANGALQQYISHNFETPHGYDPRSGQFEECSCGHWRIKK